MAEKAAKLTVNSVKSALQSVIAPDLNEIKASIKVLETRHEATNTKIDSLRNELRSDIARVEQKVDSNAARLEQKISSLSEKVDLIKDVEKLKIEVAELKRRR